VAAAPKRGSWAWHLASWLLTLLLMGISAVAAYLLAQVLFAVFIMDLMSRITQRGHRDGGGIADGLDPGADGLSDPTGNAP
jgi:hypothetical protein